jgi:hypothetical protein
MWVQRQEMTQEMTDLRSQLAKSEAQLAEMAAQLDAIKYGGADHIISSLKTTLVGNFFADNFPRLATFVVHITNINPAVLWTFMSTSPGNENQTVRALGATVMRDREHTRLLCGDVVIHQWSEKGEGVGLERGEDEQAVRGGEGDPSGHGSAPGDDRQPEGGQTEVRPTQIWGSRFCECDPNKDMKSALYFAFRHHHKKKSTKCAIAGNTFHRKMSLQYVLLPSSNISSLTLSAVF